MKEIVSKNVSPSWLKRRKKDQAKVTTYWSNLYPMPYAEDMTKDYKEAMTKIATKAKDVVFTGVLKQTKDGFVYVDVDNSILKGFLALLPEAEKTPRNKKSNDIGAHITVIKNREVSENDIKFKDVDKEIEYTITGVDEVVDPDGWDEMEKVWFLRVDAPELEKLRKKYKLSPRIKNHNFHITIGVKPRGSK